MSAMTVPAELESERIILQGAGVRTMLVKIFAESLAGGVRYTGQQKVQSVRRYSNRAHAVVNTTRAGGVLVEKSNEPVQ